LDLLLFLLEAVRHAPLLILAVSRQAESSALDRITQWAEKHLSERFVAIHLRNLSLDQSHRLLLQLLSVPDLDLPAHLRQKILERCDGVPFYLEEILRMLIDHGVLRKEDGRWQMVNGGEIENLGVPDTLQGLILARFDRLPPFQRHLLQVASVIGHQFQLRLLKALLQPEEREEVDQALACLVEREFIVPIADPPDAIYAFRHVLMSEAIYATLLKRERSQWHGLVGEAIERLYADRLEEQVELLARHYSWSPRLERALHYLIRAGQRAASRYVNEQALFHFKQALDLLPQVAHTSEQALNVHLGLGDVQFLVGDYATAFHHYEAALLAIAEEQDETFVPVRSALQRKIARTLERQGDYEQALSRLTQALQILSTIPNPPPTEKAQVLSDIGWLRFRQGNFMEAEQLLTQALSLVENCEAYDVIASIYNRLGGVAYNQGDWNRTANYLRKSIALRESIGDMMGLATSFNNLGLLGIEMGDFDNALENLSRSYELKSRLGQAEGISMTLNNLGWLRIQRGELDEAEQCLNQALELARQIGYTSLMAEVLKNLGELHLKSQAWDKARQTLVEAAHILSELGTRDQLVDTYTLLGEAALSAGDLAGAQACLEKIQGLSISLADDTRELSTVQRGEFWRFRGMLATQLGEWESASQYLNISEKIFQSLGSRLHQGRAAYQLGCLAEARGEARAARLRYREAALLFRSVGARLEQKRAEEAYQRLSG
jgi:predicted ATPase